MRDLELQGVQDQLDRSSSRRRPWSSTSNASCRRGRIGRRGCRLALPVDFEARMNRLASHVERHRLLLLNYQARMVYDSSGMDTFGAAVSVTPSTRVAKVGEARTTLEGQVYIAAAATIAPARDPPGATYVVVGLPRPWHPQRPPATLPGGCW